MTTTATKPKRARRFARTPSSEVVGVDQAKVITEGAPASTPPEPPQTSSESKISGVVAMLQRAEGATLAELVSATGWLPHTTRAALTGLKKKGHPVTRGKRGDTTCYHIAEPA